MQVVQLHLYLDELVWPEIQLDKSIHRDHFLDNIFCIDSSKPADFLICLETKMLPKGCSDI